MSSKMIDIINEFICVSGGFYSYGKYGCPALSGSSQEGHTDVVRLLLQQPNIDVNKGQEGWPPLKLANHFKFPEIVKLLTDAGAK